MLACSLGECGMGILSMNIGGVVTLPWYRSLNREQWRVLVASNLGWTFDGFEVFALFLTVGFALHRLLDGTQYAQIPRYATFTPLSLTMGSVST
jgi:hypothetical protein